MGRPYDLKTNPKAFFGRHDPEHPSNLENRREPYVFLTYDGGIPRERKSEFDPMAVSFLPYGVWTYENGDEILFTRSYKAVWARRVSLAGDMIDCFMSPKLLHESSFMDMPRVGEEYFRSDGVFNPRLGDQHIKRCRKIVGAFISGESIRDYIIE